MKKNHLDQAKHNEKVCLYLNRKAEFADWVITTAFYAAMHFFYHKALPTTVRFKKGRAKAESFSQLYTVHPLAEDRSKHEFTMAYIEDKYPEIADEYQFLWENSSTARYNNYNYPRDVSARSVECLKTVKAFCTS